MINNHRDGNGRTGTCDIVFSNGSALVSAVLMSLFSWRRARPSDETESGRRYGWWTDTPQRQLGSRLYLFTRRSITPGLMTDIKTCIQEALAWMVEDQLCSSVSVGVTQGVNSPDRVVCKIGIFRHDGSHEAVVFDDLWRELQGIPELR